MCQMIDEGCVYKRSISPVSSTPGHTVYVFMCECFFICVRYCATVPWPCCLVAFWSRGAHPSLLASLSLSLPDSYNTRDQNRLFPNYSACVSLCTRSYCALAHFIRRMSARRRCQTYSKPPTPATQRHREFSGPHHHRGDCGGDDGIGGSGVVRRKTAAAAAEVVERIVSDVRVPRQTSILI